MKAKSLVRLVRREDPGSSMSTVGSGRSRPIGPDQSRKSQSRMMIGIGMPSIQSKTLRIMRFLPRQVAFGK